MQLPNKIKESYQGTYSKTNRLSEAQAHEAYVNFIKEENKENVFTYIKEGWIKEALGVLNESDMGPNPWLVEHPSYKSSDQLASLLHEWAKSRIESSDDQNFLDEWLNHHHDLTGEHMAEQKWARLKKTLRPDAYVPNIQNDSIPRVLVAYKNFNKFQQYLQKGGPWADAHASLFLECADFARTPEAHQKKLEIVHDFLDLPNVKEWINKTFDITPTAPILGAVGKNALSILLEAECDGIKGLTETIKKCIEKGADINADLGRGNTILHKVMLSAPQNAYKNRIKYYLKLGASLAKQNDQGATPLAVFFNRRDVSSLNKEEIIKLEGDFLKLQVKDEKKSKENTQSVPRKTL